VGTQQSSLVWRVPQSSGKGFVVLLKTFLQKFMLMKFINHYKNFASCEFSVFVAYQANFCKICALMIKAQKQHLKSSYKAKTLNL